MKTGLPVTLFGLLIATAFALSAQESPTPGTPPTRGQANAEVIGEILGTKKKTEVEQAAARVARGMPELNRAIELNPKDATAYVNRAVVKQTKGDLDGAIADYSRAIALNRDFAAAYLGRGRLKRTMGDRLGAMDDLDRALQLQNARSAKQP